MKKILVTLFLVSSLVFSFAASAMADSVYVDGFVESKSDWQLEDIGDGDDDNLSGFVLGGNFSGDRVTLGLEYLDRTLKTAYGDMDTDTVYIKGGFTLFANDANNVAVTLGYDKLDFSDSSLEYNGIILGINGTFNLSENSRLEGSLGYSVSGTCESDILDEDITILLLNAKYSYFFTDCIGASVGYRFEQYEFDDLDLKTTFSGPTVGLTFKFN